MWEEPASKPQAPPTWEPPHTPVLPFGCVERVPIHTLTFASFVFSILVDGCPVYASSGEETASLSLSSCDVLSVPSLPLLPAEVVHLGKPGFLRPTGAVNIVALVAEMGKAVVRALEKEKGDVLVFMPGVAQIRRCAVRPVDP